MQVKRVFISKIKGSHAVCDETLAQFLPHLAVVSFNNRLVGRVLYKNVAHSFREIGFLVVKHWVRGDWEVFIAQSGTSVKISDVVFSVVPAVISDKDIIVVIYGCRTEEKHLLFFDSIDQSISNHSAFRRCHHHILSEIGDLYVITVITFLGNEILVVSCNRAITRICRQMLVPVVRHVIGFQHCRIIFQNHIVEQLRKSFVTGILTFFAENVGTIVHSYMNIAVAVEVARLLVEMCAVAVEIRRVLA